MGWRMFSCWHVPPVRLGQEHLVVVWSTGVSVPALPGYNSVGGVEGCEVRAKESHQC